MKYYVIDRNGKIRCGYADTWNKVKSDLRDGETLYNPHTKKRVIGWNKYKAEMYAVAHPQQRIEAPYPHFRYYKKSGHPALLVGEQKAKDKEEYKFRKVMHGERDGDKLNERVFPNPDPKDPDPMYIGKRVRHDDKETFDYVPLPWKYPKK